MGKSRSEKSREVVETVVERSDEQKRAEQAAKELKKAISGLGTDEETIIKIVVGNSNKQLQLIKNEYLLAQKQHLWKALEQNISGNFRDIILALLNEKNVFQAEIMNRAISDIGGSEDLIIHSLCTKSARELNNLKEGYLKRFQRDLVADIKEVKDGDYNDIFLKLASADRRSNHGYDISESRALAERLVAATPKGDFIDEDVYVDVISTTSFAQLRSVFDIFSEIYGQDIFDVVEPRTKGSMKQLLLTMIKCSRSRARHFAEKIHYALSGAGTRDRDLIELIVSRYDIDMADIKIEYFKLYKEHLYKAIKSETSGDFKKVLLILIGE